MTPDTERLYVANLLRNMLTLQRKGQLYLLEEKLGMLAYLLEHPGWHGAADVETLRRDIPRDVQEAA